MTAEPVEPVPLSAVVVLDDGHVRIHDLSVDGAMVTLAREAIAAGRDLELTVRQALDIGAAVLLHGGAKGTVDAVSAEVDRLLTALNERSARIEAVRRVQERVASKGLSFEDDLGPALDVCFSPHQDIFETTGASKGIADDKVGDFVVTVNPRDTGGRDRRIVFEAKDRSLSVSKALSELDAAMLNRNAQVGVMVFAHQTHAPLAGKPFRAFPGNRLMVVWDTDSGAGSTLALEVCAQLARALAIASQHKDSKLNRKILADRLEQLINVVERASEIQRGISSARRGLDAAEDAHEQMTEEALALLLELRDRL